MFHFRPFQKEDGGKVMELQQHYAHRHPGAAVIPWEVYASPSFAGGQNVTCAFDGQGRLAGYAPLFPVLVSSPETPAPHTLWAEVRIEPGRADGPALRRQLFEKTLAQARQVTAANPHRPARLTFQYLAIEAESIAFALANGLEMGDAIYQMKCSLTAAIPDFPPPPGFTIRSWRMESAAEQEEYVAARNLAFPGAPITLADWQYYLQSPQWASGMLVAAFHENKLAGGVLVYWAEPDPDPQTPKTAHSEDIFVLPALQGRGLGHSLVSAALHLLQEQGCRLAALEVIARNEHALALYRSLGYRVAKETRLFTLDL